MEEIKYKQTLLKRHRLRCDKNGFWFVDVEFIFTWEIESNLTLLQPDSVNTKGVLSFKNLKQ
jgi:hypothetical protein